MPLHGCAGCHSGCRCGGTEAGVGVNWGRAGKDARGPISLEDPKASQTEMSPGRQMPRGPKCLPDRRRLAERAAGWGGRQRHWGKWTWVGEGMGGAAQCRAEWRQRGACFLDGAAVTADRVWRVGNGQAGAVSRQAEGAFRSFRAGSVRSVTDRMTAQRR